MQSAESDRRNTRQISRSVESERSVDATDRNNNLTPCSPEFPEPVVPIYESTFCLCGNKHFNLREGEGSCSMGKRQSRRVGELISSNHV